MGLKNYYKFLEEVYMISVLKMKGYSMIDVTGNDGVVTTYFKKLGLEKELKIGKHSYPINKNKRMLKHSMPYFRFTGSVFGENYEGKTTVTKFDADTMQEIIKKARLVGQNTAKGDGKTILYMVLGGAIGFLVCWVVLSMLGGA